VDRWLVLLSENIHADGKALLEQHADVRIASAPDEATLREEARDADAIILRSRGYVSARVMDGASRLRVIGRHGVGVDNVDIAAATARGVQVVNVPDANVTSVAEHVVGMILSLARHIRQADRAVRSGDWVQRDRDLGMELTGGTLGVVGLGTIGQAVARMCHAAFDMTILYSDTEPRPRAEKALAAHRLTLDELLGAADVVTLHVPLLSSTRDLVGRRELEIMRPGALLVNTSRGGVVDEFALTEALHEGRLGGAAIDVFAEEPPPLVHPLLACDRVLLTPHSAAMTEQASKRMARVAEDILAVLEGEEPRYPVNHLPARR
jgi:D-3-phosphoglycerate dehydrogenase / 2-oxoglutarate reductase